MTTPQEHSASVQPFVQSLWRTEHVMLRNSLLAVGGSLLLFISAKVQVPFYPVPLSMQTFVVFLIGMGFGWRLGGATVLLYLAQGAMGLPVFAGTPTQGIGLAYLLGPTGGYLLGFWVAALGVGWLAERGWNRQFWRTLLALVLGNCAIYALGLSWLGAVIGWDQPLLALGLFPFLLGDAVKIVLAAVLLPMLWQRLHPESSRSA